MNNVTSAMGMNRTGLAIHPLLSKEMTDNTAETVPGTPGDEHAIAAVREFYARDVDRIGAVPPPATLKGVVGAAVDMLKGQRTTALIDKLAERLAFERSGTRLWQAAISKFDVCGTWEGGPSRDDLLAIAEDEAQHFSLLHHTIANLGADPTVVTPSADLAGVEAMGIVQVLTDPRTNLAQGLHAMLIAELADNDAWAMLIDVTSQEDADLAARFTLARDAESRHLRLVRQWLVAHGRLEASGGLPRDTNV